MAIIPFNLQKNLLVNASGNLMCLDASQPFTIKINTIYGNGNNTFALPLTNHTTNLKIETSDGQLITITNYTDPAKLINFPSAGIYTIKMRGECGWSFNNTGDCQKLIGISNWGRLKLNAIIDGFYGCINLGLNDGLPVNGSINISAYTSMRFLFRNCNLTSVGSVDLMKLSVNITSLDGAFRDNKLTSIPSGFFDKNTKVTIFSQAFYNNPITSIPTGLFDKNTKATNFAATFQSNNLTSIPSGLFDNCINVTTFGQAFYNNKLTSIPPNLFDNNIKVTSFDITFGNNLISSIPINLFYFNTLVTTFKSTFSINLITTIPSNLFNNNIKVTSFQGTFSNNLITSIPSGLFDNCINVTTFGQAFYNNPITSIPTGLFDKNTKATNFAAVFRYTALATIPYRLFYNNKLVTDYKFVFANLTANCTVPTEIFDTSVLNIVTTFEYAMQQTTAKSMLGVMQDIWNYTSGTVLKTNCFIGDISLTNYASIPNNWKGL